MGSLTQASTFLFGTASLESREEKMRVQIVHKGGVTREPA